MPFVHAPSPAPLSIHRTHSSLQHMSSKRAEIAAKRARLFGPAVAVSSSAADAAAVSGAEEPSSSSAAAAAASPANEPRLEQLTEDYLTCTICKKTMLHCVALPCSHMFCRYCINQWFYVGGRKKCGICRAVHTRAVTMRVQHMDRLIEAVVCVSPESEREHKERLKAADEENEELLERIKKDRAEKDAQDSKDADEALRGSSSDEEDDESFNGEQSSSESEEEEEEETEEQEEERNRRRYAKPAAAEASSRVTRGQKRK